MVNSVKRSESHGGTEMKDNRRIVIQAWFQLRTLCNTTLAALIVVSLGAPPAIACGGIFDVACNLSNGGLSPGNIGEQLGQAGEDIGSTVDKAGQDVADALNELQANLLTGPALEQAIIASYNSAIGTSMPIAQDMRSALTGYASESSLNRARFKIGDNGFLNLARLLEQGGFADAVTLDNLIIFRGPSEASNPSIWAHELVHVDQYNGDIRSFSVRYSRNYRSIEDPAYEKGDNYWNWANQRNTQTQPQQSSQFPANSTGEDQGGTFGLPSGFGMQVCGCWGPFPPIMAAEPRCASGAVHINQCPGFCAPGQPVYAYVCQ